MLMLPNIQIKNRDMTKKVKNLEFTEDIIMKLTIKAAKRGMKFKPYCEEVLERDANSLEIVFDTAKVEKTEDALIQEDIEVDTTEPPTEDLDTSGIFKKVEEKIYTNKKCFEYRELVKGEGVVKHHFATLLEAQEKKNSN